MGTSLNDLLGEIRACTVCAESLEAGPRPIVQASPTARLVIIGQAPGRKVHESGVPWDDPSGRTLRAWLGVTDEEDVELEELVAQVRRLHEDEALRATLTQGALASAELLTWDARGQKLITHMTRWLEAQSS